MTIRTAAAALVTVLCIGTSTAQATVIDFRLDPWGPGGSGTETNGGVTVEALPPVLDWDSTDGFGVDSDRWGLNTDREDDEVNNGEILRVTFAGGTNVTGFLLTDLFFENGAAERAFYSINGGAWTSVSAPVSNVPGSTNGELWVNFAPVFVNTLSFGYPIAYALDTRNDFAVGAVRVAAVPEPASLLMLTSGLVGAFLARRRRQASA